jgi:tRNA A37 threonylcarbamoyladenosine modification protein TsaB
MKPFLFIILTFLSVTIYAQINQNSSLTGKVDKNLFIQQDLNVLKDSIPRVVLTTKKNIQMEPVYFINGQHIKSSTIRTLDPNLIKEMNVEKDSVELNGNNYYGKIYITTKNNYQPKLISLNKLQKKYTTTSNNPIVFLLDNEIIDEDYDNFLIDENYILKIEVTDLANSKEKLNITLVKLFTRSRENIEKENKIYIRGELRHKNYPSKIIE